MKTVRCTPTLAAFAMGALLLSCGPLVPRARADQDTDNANVKKLLDQADYQAWRLSRDTDAMTGIVRSEATWQADADELERVRAHVNDLGKLIAELQSSRVDASRWQRESIDRVVPLLSEVAKNTTDEIKFLDKYQHQPMSVKYDHWVNQSSKTAHELAETIQDTVQYGEDRGQLAEQSDSIGLKTGPTQ